MNLRKPTLLAPLLIPLLLSCDSRPVFEPVDLAPDSVDLALDRQLVNAGLGAPSGLQAPFSYGKARLSWTDNSNDEITFRIFRKKQRNDGTWPAWARVKTVGANVTNWSDGSVVVGKKYRYKVKAWNADGGSSYSNVANIEIPAPSRPAAPTALGASPSSNQVDLTWTDNADNEDSFRIYRRKKLGDGSWTAWSKIKTVGRDATAYSDGTAQAGDTYKYRLKAWNDQGGSDYSNPEKAIVPAAAPLTITTTSLDDGRKGVSASTALAATGGTGTGLDWSISAGALPAGVSLSAGGVLSGTPTKRGNFSFTARVEDSGANTDTQDIDLYVCGPALSLSVGQSRSQEFPDRCGEVLPASAGTYRIALMARETGAGPAALPDDLRLAAVAGTPGEAFLSPISFKDLAMRGALSAQDQSMDQDLAALARATEELSYRLREEEIRRDLATPMPAAAHLGPPRTTVSAEEADFTPPSTRTFWVTPGSGTRVSVDATLRASNDYVVYYEDDGVVSDGSRATDQEVADLLAYYAAVGNDIITNTFGGLGPSGTTDVFADGIRSTDDLDGNGGRIIALQVRAAYMPSGAAAYVSSCDRYPHQNNATYAGYYCTGSNEAEITYLSHPGDGDGTSDADEWFYFGSLVHEVKHISSHGFAIYGNRGFNPSWIEEGTAEMAKDKSSRDAAGFSDGARVGLWDIYDIGTGQSSANTYGMAVVNSRARSFLKASPLSALVGNPSPNPYGSTYYGAGWLFHRWLTDAYGGAGEDAFLSSLNTGGSGESQIEAVTGKTLEDLMTQWLIAIGVEGQATARAATGRRFESYDYSEISSGWSEIWPYLQASSAFTSGNFSFDSHYTSPNFFDFTGIGSTALRLDAFAKNGDALSSLDQVILTITRIQ